MYRKMYNIPKREPMPLDEWEDWMIWCPSQCYLHARRNDVDYILYLRWRHDDPWEGYVIKHATNEDDMVESQAEWSPCLFEQNDVWLDTDQVEEAKAKLLELFEQYLTENNENTNL